MKFRIRLLFVILLSLYGTNSFSEALPHGQGTGPRPQAGAPIDSNARIMSAVSACLTGRPDLSASIGANPNNGPQQATPTQPGPPVNRTNNGPPVSNLPTAGDALFKVACVRCHNPFQKDKQKAINAINSGEMPDRKSGGVVLNEAQRKLVIDYIQKTF